MKILIAIFTISIFSLVPVSAFAQDSLTLTITPPLVKINMKPGENWSSTVKVVNNNNEPLKVYTQTLDFKSSENGGVAFIQKQDAAEAGRFQLSHWLTIDPGPFEIPAQASQEIPFTISVPEEGEPGGHYAAIVVGTKPQGKIQGTGIAVASQLASLLMLNVSGDVIEKGDIREFSTSRSLYQQPQAEFTVRFENTGNVHIQPQGEIAVYNMQHKEVARIPINHDTEFGSVLPDSTRQWIFDWQGEPGIFKMGRRRPDTHLRGTGAPNRGARPVFLGYRY